MSPNLKFLQLLIMMSSNFFSQINTKMNQVDS